MRIQKTLIIGMVSGLIMGIALFIGGAITSRIIYGPQFAPDGKFDPSQMNAFYFIWTKLVIGLFFGILFAIISQLSSISKKMTGFWKGVGYGSIFWVVIWIWNISHPLVYGSVDFKDQLFWFIYSLCGFTTLGGMLGYFIKKYS